MGFFTKDIKTLNDLFMHGLQVGDELEQGLGGRSARRWNGRCAAAGGEHQVHRTADHGRPPRTATESTRTVRTRQGARAAPVWTELLSQPGEPAERRADARAAS